jgi:hypothetical protein
VKAPEAAEPKAVMRDRSYQQELIQLVQRNNVSNKEHQCLSTHRLPLLLVMQ